MALLSPHLGDKLVDWKLIEVMGGQGLFTGKDVLEFGPSYGIDLIMWAPWTASYTMIESAADVLDHLHPIVAWLGQHGRTVSIIPHNLQAHIPLPDQCVDVVIDFGTIDNVLAGYGPYMEAARLLRPGGHLLSTYANRLVLQEPTSSCGDEQRFYPNDLLKELGSVGLSVCYRIAEDQPRAGLICQKSR